MKKIEKISKKITIIVFLVIIVLFVYIGTPKKIKINHLSNEDKNIIISELNLKYLPSSTELISIEIPKINIDTYYYINYLFDSNEKNEFVKENSIYGSKKYDIKFVKEKNNKVYYSQILTQENNLEKIQKILNNSLNLK